MFLHMCSVHRKLLHGRNDGFTSRSLCSVSLSLQIGLRSVTVFPGAPAAGSFLMLLAWPFAFTASLGRSDFVLEPQSWWRRFVDVCLRVIMRVKGERAPPSEVPILTVAPHSSYFDAIPVTNTMCSIVTKLESRSIPLISYIRPVFVFRPIRNSRKKTVEEIKRRAQSGGKWPQVKYVNMHINPHTYLTLALVLSIPGLPVQPVILRYPNKLDLFCLSLRLKILWLTLCQPHNSMEIEYLPVYTPSDEEKINPSLFANNVRKLMAEALGAPLTDLSFDDREISLSHGPLSVHDCSGLLEFNRLVCRLGKVKAGSTAEQLEELARRARKLQGGGLTLEHFALFLNLPVSDTLRQIHRSEDGQIDVRHYVTALSTVYRPSKSMETVKLAFKMYENEDGGEILEEDLAVTLEIMLGVMEVDLSAMFLTLGKPDTGRITFHLISFHSKKKIGQSCLIFSSLPDEFYLYVQQNPHTLDWIDFRDHPRRFCVRPHDKSCNGQKHGKDE
uniref:Lysophosphatidylcholine acyltransferase 1 n=1 Tax=Salarias fasciatus TaxID=181472 RepID=A0A672IF60_SALFA